MWVDSETGVEIMRVDELIECRCGGRSGLDDWSWEPGLYAQHTERLTGSTKEQGEHTRGNTHGGTHTGEHTQGETQGEQTQGKHRGNTRKLKDRHWNNGDTRGTTMTKHG